jgi:hypothetical protein
MTHSLLFSEDDAFLHTSVFPMMVAMACNNSCIYYISIAKSITLFYTVTTVWYFVFVFVLLCFLF